MLTIQHLSKYYGETKALDDVSLEVGKGIIFGLLGPNGAGKSTLIRNITRILMPDSGTILLDGSPLLQQHIQHIGYMPEERGLYKKMMVGEQLLYLARLKGLSSKEACARLDYWLERFQIASWEKKNIEDLSKGMQQKIQFIAAVITRPQLLILDEPMTGLDPINADLLKEEILRLRNEGTTILLSTHRMESVEELCQEIALIDKGKIILQGAVAAIRRDFSKHIIKIKVTDSSGLDDMPILERDGDTLFFALEEKKDTNFFIKKLIDHNKSIVLVEEVIPTIHEIFVESIKNHA